ncbi:unnamed protein product, partial [Ectocarpus sp. 4 AP-2014]
VATAVREQQQRREESSRRVERANLSLTLLVKKLERSLFVLSSRDLFWEEVGTKLKAHAEAFADASCRVEATSEEQDRFVLTVELQQYIAGNTQRVAKLICQKADFEVIQKLTASTNIEKGAQDWDRRVQSMRGSFLEHFVANARRYLDRKYPSHGPFGARNRDRFYVKLEQGLKVAMSKYRSVDVGNTLFGKVKLDPSCIACDRPFGAAAQARNGYLARLRLATLGDARAAPLEPLPPPQAVKDAMTGRPRMPATPPDGTRTPEPFVDPAMVGGFGGGNHQKNTSKFVYRGGFKIPKELTPMPSVESLGAFPGDAGSTIAMGSINVNFNGVSECEVDPSREHSTSGGDGSDSRTRLRDRGGSRRGVEQDPGLFISSSRMRVGGGNERGLGGGREGIKMPRPKTANATLGREHTPFSTGVRRGA